MDALLTDGLSRRFGDRRAVEGLGMMVPHRSIYGFLGANGAGKTTSLRMILGLIKPDRGRIVLFGKDAQPFRYRPGVGSLIETPSLYPHLTGAENLDITRRLLGLGTAEVGRQTELVGLSDAAHRPVGTYSLGMKQRLALARAILGSPKLLILDEPTNGLDPEGIVAMRQLLRTLPEQADMTLLISSHLLTEVEQIATHVGLMHRGRLLVQDRLDHLLNRGTGAIVVETRDQAAAGDLLRKAGMSIVQTDCGRWQVQSATGPSLQPDDVGRLLVEKGQRLVHLTAQRIGLEDIYHRHIRKAA